MLEKQRCNKCHRSTWISDTDPLSKPIRMSGFEIKQKGRVFYVVKVKAKDLDRLCWVPAIDANKDNNQLAELILSPHRTESWQREVDTKRLADIGEFFSKPDSHFVNSVIIGLPAENENCKPTNLEGNVGFTIKVDWMVQKCNLCNYEYRKGPADSPIVSWFDRCPDHDCENHFKETRPAYIIDGQHRIRGSQKSGGSYPDETLVATILTEDQFSAAKQAKIFTEITTSAEDLEPLHKLFLLYKFKLRAKVESHDIDMTDLTNIGLRNRRAYEIAGTLCCTGSKITNPFFGRITIFRTSQGHRRAGDFIEILSLMRLLTGWLDRGNALYDSSQIDRMKTKDKAAEELIEYIRSVINLYASNPTYWTNKRTHIGTLQQRGIFYLVLSLFEKFAKRLDDKLTPRIQAEFDKELVLIKRVRWDKNRLERWNTPERARNLLLSLFLEKIEQAPNTLKPIVKLDTYLDAKPDSFSWIATTSALNGKSLTALFRKGPVKIEWTRPINGYQTATISITQGDTSLLPASAPTSTASDNSYELKALPTILSKGSNAKPISITVTYSNPVGHTSMTLKMKP